MIEDGVGEIIGSCRQNPIIGGIGGLGMAIVREGVEREGSKKKREIVWGRSTPDAGTTLLL